MRRIFRGKLGGFAGFLLIAALVAGGLGWVTSATLRLEREQLQAAPMPNSIRNCTSPSGAWMAAWPPP